MHLKIYRVWLKVVGRAVIKFLHSHHMERNLKAQITLFQFLGLNIFYSADLHPVVEFYDWPNLRRRLLR